MMLEYQVLWETEQSDGSVIRTASEHKTEEAARRYCRHASPPYHRAVGIRFREVQPWQSLEFGATE